MSWLRSPHLFPVLIMAMCAVASLRYACARDWGRVMYWVCAAGITFSATFLVGRR